MTANWPDKAPDSELFDRISPHISEYTDDIAIKNICAEFQQDIEQLRAALIRIVEFADINPFMSLGHMIEHLVPEARAILNTPQQEQEG